MRNRGTAKTLFKGMIIIVILTPFVPLLLWAFSEKWFYPSLVPEQFGTRAWNYVLSTAHSQLLDALWNSTLLASVTSVISVAIAYPAARSLGLSRLKAISFFQFIFMLPIIVPPLSVAMGLHFWFLKLNLADSFAGVVLIHATISVPYAIFVLWGLFSNYDVQYEHQARSLGAAGFKLFAYVIWPMIRPGIIVALLFSFLLSWSQYLNTLIIGGGKILTLPILLFSLMTSGDRPVAAAAGIVFIIPALGALFISSKFLGKKMIAGGW